MDDSQKTFTTIIKTVNNQDSNQNNSKNSKNSGHRGSSGINVSNSSILRFFLIGIVVLLTCGLLYYIRDALVIIFLGFFFAIILNRPVDWLTRKIHKRGLSITIVVLLVILFILFCISSIIPYLISQLGNFVASLSSAVQNFETDSAKDNNFFFKWLDSVGFSQYYDTLLTSISQELSNFFQNYLSYLPSTLSTTLGSFSSGLMVFISVLMIAIFALSEGKTWAEKFWNQFSRSSEKTNYYKNISLKMYDVISNYVVGTLVLALIASVVTALATLILSFIFPEVPTDLFIPLMLVMFVSSLIPMFGGVIGTVLVEVLLILYSFPAALIMLAIMLVFQFLQGNVITPKIFAKHSNLTPLLIMISILIGSSLGGFVGVLLAIPIGGCIVVIIQEWFAYKNQSNPNT